MGKYGYIHEDEHDCNPEWVSTVFVKSSDESFEQLSEVKHCELCACFIETRNDEE